VKLADDAALGRNGHIRPIEFQRAASGPSGEEPAHEVQRYAAAHTAHRHQRHDQHAAHVSVCQKGRLIERQSTMPLRGPNVNPPDGWSLTTGT
jgi:hypothetical protein